MPTQSRSQSFVPLDQRSENESSGSNHFRHAPCRLRLGSEPGNQNSVISHCYFKMDAPRALVFRPLIKGNEALGTRLGGLLINEKEENEGIE